MKSPTWQSRIVQKNAILGQAVDMKPKLGQAFQTAEPGSSLLARPIEQTKTAFLLFALSSDMLKNGMFKIPWTSLCASVLDLSTRVKGNMCSRGGRSLILTNSSSRFEPGDYQETDQGILITSEDREN